MSCYVNTFLKIKKRHANNILKLSFCIKKNKSFNTYILNNQKKKKKKKKK